jgi:hypothetical protein
VPAPQPVKNLIPVNICGVETALPSAEEESLVSVYALIAAWFHLGDAHGVLSRIAVPHGFSQFLAACGCNVEAEK